MSNLPGLARCPQTEQLPLFLLAREPGYHTPGQIGVVGQPLLPPSSVGREPGTPPAPLPAGRVAGS